MRSLCSILAVVLALARPPVARAIVQTYFTGYQPAVHTASGATSETLSSGGYLFTFSMDKWWSPTGTGPATGRSIAVQWPAGLGAQTQTAGPAGPLAQQVSANITIRRADGKPFAVPALTVKILGNTAAAGAAVEIMPQRNGQDAFADPLALDATGYAGTSFPYLTPQLTGYDTYHISLWMDFAITALTLVDDSLPQPVTLLSSTTSSNTLRLRWPLNAYGYGLRSAPAVTGVPFVPVPVLPTINGADQVVELPMTNRSLWFRLQQ